jgi:multidrug efflux pump subunit AcrB
VARQVKILMDSTRDVVDVDWMVEEDLPSLYFEVDKEKAMRNGVAPAQAVATMNAALTGLKSGTLYQPASFEPVNIMLQLNDAEKASVSDLKNINIIGQQEIWFQWAIL